MEWAYGAGTKVVIGLVFILAMQILLKINAKKRYHKQTVFVLFVSFALFGVFSLSKSPLNAY